MFFSVSVIEASISKLMVAFNGGLVRWYASSEVCVTSMTSKLYCTDLRTVITTVAIENSRSSRGSKNGEA